MTTRDALIPGRIDAISLLRERAKAVGATHVANALLEAALDLEERNRKELQ